MKVFLAQPHCNDLEPRSVQAANMCVDGADGIEVFAMRPCFSLLPYNFNRALAEARNHRVDYFAMLHSDVSAQPGFLTKMIEDIGTADIIHAPVRLKDNSGNTSTAVAYTDNKWQRRRRITVKELKKLPQVFGIDDCRSIYGDGYCLLPNTGCLLMGRESYNAFPGFHESDRLVCVNGRWEALAVSEDYNLGYWAAANGYTVKGTKNVITKHCGTKWYSTEETCGHETDAQFIAETTSATFDEAWNAASAIDGWLSQDEGRALFEAACSLPPDKRAIEVGAYRGRSTVILAKSGATVDTIDPMAIGDFPEGKMKIREEDVEALRETVNQYPRCKWHRMKCEQFAPHDDIGLLFIDGNHQTPIEDFNHFKGYLCGGCIVAFHDCGKDYPAVANAIEKLHGEGALNYMKQVESLWIGQVPQ